MGLVRFDRLVARHALRLAGQEETIAIGLGRPAGHPRLGVAVRHRIAAQEAARHVAGAHYLVQELDGQRGEPGIVVSVGSSEVGGGCRPIGQLLPLDSDSAADPGRLPEVAGHAANRLWGNGGHFRGGFWRPLADLLP